MAKNNITIKITDWASHKQQLSNIRRLVFIEEQNVPEELEWDEFDESCYHFLATINDKTIACARLKPDGHIGRMAVLKPFRNQGIGSKLLEFVLNTAKNKAIYRLTLYAQVSAIAFYEKKDFVAVGDIFYDAGIPHRKMLKNID